ncbi:MAG: hypothetical protein IK134_09495, partial [Oscillospiraceae bacterium]|nr:hypothetical protein [Oscillospiraceae bacterium]
MLLLADSVRFIIPLTAVHDIANIQRIITGMQRFFDEKQRIRWGIAQKQDNSIIGHCGFFDID